MDERGKGLLLMFLIFFEAERKGGDTTKAVTDDGGCEQRSIVVGELRWEEEAIEIDSHPPIRSPFSSYRVNPSGQDSPRRARCMKST